MRDLPAISSASLPRLLIVDDEAVSRYLLENLFAPDYEVVCAFNAQGALDVLNTDAFDVVLLDLHLPDQNGLYVLDSIRSRPETADLPVILLVPEADRHDAAWGLKQGANDYLTTPVEAMIARARVSTQIKLKRMTDERKQSMNRLEQLHTMLKQLFHVAFHDLKNMVTSMRAAQVLARDSVGDAPDAIANLDTIDDILDAMQSMMEDYMQMAVTHNGKLDLTLAQVSLNDVIWGVVLQQWATAWRKKINLQVSQIDEAVVIADANFLTQVMTNLISNGIKYSLPNSTVTVSTATYDDRIRIMVADQGPGIPENERHLLFKPFSKLSPRPTAGESSTGLGLWIVRYLTTAQGGSVGYDPVPHGGSIFWVELPRAG